MGGLRHHQPFHIEGPDVLILSYVSRAPNTARHYEDLYEVCTITTLLLKLNFKKKIMQTTRIQIPKVLFHGWNVGAAKVVGLNTEQYLL